VLVSFPPQNKHGRCVGSTGSMEMWSKSVAIYERG